ncbi:ferredoxin-thioredoxin reductase, variable chain, chloroplastic [Manihot esculenta]|uniref:Ferredoxin thioredoxin reductase alpha chain domain-containing protein n=1 Tax=Manihot esculenta TaxID=3983 RepID=A0A2C9U8B5_MANES|nr:ferredoxin-thioredoxin reductase, variable chain, chloroplastic [Manihot esculenta]OAY25851.1 hypothetical protein MANES_16G000200v8 [Manihot esculenta]
MSSTTLALPSAGGAASGCSSLNRPIAFISSAFRSIDMSVSTVTLSKKSLVCLSSSSSSSSSSSPSSAILPATRTNINNGSMMIICSVKGRYCYSTIPAGIMITERRKKRLIPCDVALRSNISASSSLSSSSTTVTQAEEKGEEAAKKIGARVRVKVPLKVYHVPRVPEVDLTGKEGHLKQYVALWKGKRISANLPYKVEFMLDIEGRGPVKFFAHLKEDEFDYLE